MSNRPRLLIGLPLYGRGEHLEEALESLLAQTLPDIAVFISDDASDTQALAVLEGFYDPRLRYASNPERLGLVGNWRRSFEIARAEFPDAPYFAWASDHDAWHPRWAERVVAVLDADPSAVVAYPRSYRMDGGGWTLKSRDWTFDTAGLDAVRRVRRTVQGMSAGNMVYGAYRAAALERAGVFRYALLPDRLLLAELSMQGHLRQVDERLFYRRVTEPPSIERQRAAFWPDGAPRWARVPWPCQHVAIAGRALARGEGPPGLDRRERARLLAAQAYATALYGLRAGLGRLYYEKLMRRRSLKSLAAKIVGRTVEWLQRRSWGLLVLDLGRRLLDSGRPSMRVRAAQARRRTRQVPAAPPAPRQGRTRAGP